MYYNPPYLTKMIYGRTTEFQVFSPVKEPVRKQDVLDFEVKTKMSEAFWYHERLFRINLNIEIGVLLAKKRKAKKSGMIGTEFVFQVEDWGDWLREMEDDLAIDPTFVTTLGGVAYSTTRGMLMARAAGTILEGCILPIIDPTDLLGPFVD